MAARYCPQHLIVRILSRRTASCSSLRPAVRRVGPSSGQARCYAEIVVKVPPFPESISDGTLRQFTKQVGDTFERDEELATIETDKVDISVNAPEAGTLTELLASEDGTVTAGQGLLKMQTGGGGAAKETDATQQPKQAASKEQPTASQPERRAEREAAPADPKPEQPQQPAAGRETDAAASTPAQSPSRAADKSSKTEPAPPKQGELAFGNRDERRVKMNRMRLRIAERLKQSQNTAASLTTFNEVDMHSLIELRKLYKDDLLKRSGVKLGFMGAFARACVLAMKEVPTVNASIEGANGGDTVVYRDYVDISVAVATDKGLVTPVVRNVEAMDIVQIERTIADLGKKARDNKLTIEDMAGGTFTISNGGVFGSLMGTPIINLPQTAVLGLHAIKDKAVVVNGTIVIRPMMYLALTYDHRLLDGREAVTFLVKVKDYIEDPRRMLLG